MLVTATRGELGELPEGGLDPGESLADRRDGELDAACRILGVARQVFLDYLDSGMAGEPSNDRPGSFAVADVDEAGACPGRHPDEEQADVLVTYDEHGGYGHPDHIQVHRVGMAAADLAGTADGLHGHHEPRLHGRRWPTLAAESGLEPAGPGRRRAATASRPWGSRPAGSPPRSTSPPWIDRKRESMRVHASQISEDSFFLAMPDDVFTVVWGTEWYIRVRPPVPGGVRPARSSTA